MVDWGFLRKSYTLFSAMFEAVLAYKMMSIAPPKGTNFPSHFPGACSRNIGPIYRLNPIRSRMIVRRHISTCNGFR